MLDSQLRQGNSWHAKGSDGRDYRVVEWREWINTTASSDVAEHWVAGGLTLRLCTGEVVEQEADGSYAVVWNGERLERV